MNVVDTTDYDIRTLNSLNKKGKVNMSTLEAKLDRVIDDFQQVVNSDQTRDIYADRHQVFLQQEVDSDQTSTSLVKSVDWRSVLNVENPNDLRDTNILGLHDGKYLITPVSDDYDRYYHHGCSWIRWEGLLTRFDIKEADKKLMKEWFLSGGRVDGYTYPDEEGYAHYTDTMEYRDWLYFTKGILWRFTNYLLVNLVDESLTTVDEKLSLALRGMIARNTLAKKRGGSTQYTPLKDLLENPEAVRVKEELNELKSQVKDLLTQLKRKEQQLEKLG